MFISVKKNCHFALSLESSSSPLSIGEWCMSHLIVGFYINEFFFFIYFLKNYSLAFLVVDISTSVFIFLISIFLSWPFYKNFICFQFHLSILNYQILYCSMWYSFFGFLIFILSTFVKVLIVFNFIIQFRLMVLFFKFGSHCFDF